MGILDLVYAEFRLFYGEVFRRKSALVSLIIYPYLFTGFTVFVGYAYGSPKAFVERTGVNPILFMITASYTLMVFMSSVDELFWRPLAGQWTGILPYIIASPVNRFLYYFTIPIPRLLTVILLGLTSVIPVHVYYNGLAGLTAGLSIMILVTIGSLISISFAMILTGLMHRFGESWRTLNIVRPIIMILIGAFVPRAYMPPLAMAVSYSIPASYVVDIIHNMLKGELSLWYTLLSIAVALSLAYSPLGSRSMLSWERKKVKEGVKVI